MEKDKEIKGDGNSYTTEFRQYDPRLGRWLSVDPLKIFFPSLSPYCSFNNNPIYFVDPLGLKSNGKGNPKDYGVDPEGGKDESLESGVGVDEESEMDDVTDGGFKYEKYIPNAEQQKLLDKTYNTIQYAKKNIKQLKRLARSIEDIKAINSNSTPLDITNAYLGLRNIAITISPSVALPTSLTATELAIVMPLIEVGIQVIKNGLLASDATIKAYGETTVLHPGAYEGGWAMYNFLADLKGYKAKYSFDDFQTNVTNKGKFTVPDEVKDFIKNNPELIKIITQNASSVPYKSVDWGFDTEDDLNSQMAWLWGNLGNFEAAIYGGLIVGAHNK